MMPTVAIVDGVKIQFYFDEHPPPHFHAVFCRIRSANPNRSAKNPAGIVAAGETCNCARLSSEEL
jgi:hypothetical protein